MMGSVRHKSAFGKASVLAVLSSIALSGCVTTETPGGQTTSSIGSTAPTTGQARAAVPSGRFPAIPAAQLASMVSSAHCAPMITSIARTAARTATHRGFAIQICGPDREKEGQVVAWMTNLGRDIVVTTPDGQPLPRREGSVNDGAQDVTWTVFGIRSASGPLVCGLPMHNRFAEPTAVAHCRVPSN